MPIGHTTVHQIMNVNIVMLFFGIMNGLEVHIKKEQLSTTIAAKVEKWSSLHINLNLSH
jgi:hypothetical protein